MNKFYQPKIPKMHTHLAKMPTYTKSKFIYVKSVSIQYFVVCLNAFF